VRAVSLETVTTVELIRRATVEVVSKHDATKKKMFRLKEERDLPSRESPSLRP
jgi:hypothetical protein